MDGKYNKYHGNLPNVFGGVGFSDGPKTDEEIEELLAAGKEIEAKKEKIKKESYGIDFANVSHLEEPRNFHFGWWPYVSYEGKDPENDKLIIRQVVDREYIEENLHELVPAYVVYYGITSWYDEFGFEVKREVRRVNDDINEIKNVKKPAVYIRENGIIKKDGEDICFDTGVRELPDYDEKVGDLAYTIIETTENISDYKGQTQARKRLLKDKVIKVNSDTPDEEILRTFKGYTDFMKALNNPKLDEYISKKYEELKKAIIIEKEVLPLKKKLKKAEDDNKVLEARNAGLKAELEKASEILKQIKSNRIGKIFFGKKIEDKNDENKKGLK